MIALFERILFRNRIVFLAVFGALTIWMGWSASRLRVDAGFAKQLPLKHEYIQTYIKHQEQFGGANRIVLALMMREGDIFNAPFFNVLERLTDEVMFVPGVDRSTVTSIFTPNVRFVEIVEDGFSGGNVIPADFKPTPERLAQVRENIIKSGRVGQLVASDFSGAIVAAQLLETDPVTGKRLDYIAVAEFLEKNIREKIQSEAVDVHVGIHIIGFAKVIGDISEGARSVITFFGVSFLLTGLFVRIYSRSWRLTFLPLFCSVLAVTWQLGLLPMLGFGIDPMSILVPFLVFAIGVSHGVQMIRCFRNEVFSGASPVEGARSAFRQLFVPGGLALVTDTIGFLTILLIDIGIIQELAITASLGVAVIIVTNLFLLPVLLSYAGLPEHLRAKVRARRSRTDRWWRRLDIITRTGPSLAIIVVATALFIWGFLKSREIRIGDLHSGVPELRQDSRYNEDTAVITSRFSIGVDVVTVIVETVPDGCIAHDVMDTMDRFEWHMRNVPGVQSVLSIATAAKVINAGWNEGSLKWRMLPRVPDVLAQAVTPIETATGLLNGDGSVLPVHIYLTDHKAETIRRVTDAVKQFQGRFGSERANFRLATGNVGVMAATNEVVAAAQYPILLWIFGCTIVLCLITFRSWRATFCIVAPLALVSMLANALMVYLEIGLKVSTLPVAALGVGIGVDYGIYLYSRLREYLDLGAYLEEAMFRAYTMTGSAVFFTGITLAAGVGTWVFSDLKFQADMGIMLLFMFLVNMVGAIVLLPAIARWLFRHHRRGDEQRLAG